MTMKGRNKMMIKKDYTDMTKEELVILCKEKDTAINECMFQVQKNQNPLLSKCDIMKLYSCGSEKALNILRLFFQMGYGIKVGKEYYVPKGRHEDFVEDFAGKEVCV